MDQSNANIFERMGLPRHPVFLAPLAGVSDHPFRRICANEGADLTYVEMISATALNYRSENTIKMLRRHPDESRLGVQITGRSADDTARAIELLEREHRFDTIDINMGCPVAKVVKTGCGSAILKDPERVFQTVRLARQATAKPLSVKIRLGWDHASINGVEVAQAAERGGADWLTVHGRTRSDDYSAPVNLGLIGRIKAALQIPVIGNGNVFSFDDAATMRRFTGVDGVMVSRGALGDPWLFRRLKGELQPVTVDAWLKVVLQHLQWQSQEYGPTGTGAVCMRKHMLWYARGWQGVRKLREQITIAHELPAAARLIEQFALELQALGVTHRDEEARQASAFEWDPKYDMDRQLDRGVGHEGLDQLPAQA